MKKIFITATSWAEDRDSVLTKALAAARAKYKDLTIVVGYSAVSLKIATIANMKGLPVQMIAPDVDIITGEHITQAQEITIVSTTKAQYLNSVTKDGAFGITGVVAFDDGDPMALRAMSEGISVWFPLAGKVV